jgi:hypothetical protein
LEQNILNISLAETQAEASFLRDLGTYAGHVSLSQVTAVILLHKLQINFLSTGGNTKTVHENDKEDVI